MEAVTGVLLAGGKSRRMGRDKRVLEIDGRSLLDRTLSVLERLFPEIVVVVADVTPEVTGLRHRVITDLIPNGAALGGLYTGLASAGHPRVFAAACDMPFLNDRVIEMLVGRDPEADVVIPQLMTGLQPLHAVYSQRCLPALERMARSGHLKLQALVEVSGLRVQILTEAELRVADPQLLSFLNVNTPSDLELARKLCAARPGCRDDHG